MSSPLRTRAAAYDEASIRVLKGLEPVRQRPGMYTRTDSPLHIVQEVIDNAADEILSGFGSRIDVTVHADGSVTVVDDGRGIPVGLHPQEKVPVVEIVFTRLHAGGKFDKRAGGPYSFSGGLHGVGVSVTNALSERLEVTVWRDGQAHSMSFVDGEVAQPLRARPVRAGEQQHGTRVRVWPNPRYFDSAQLPLQELERLLRSKAVLLAGATVTLTVEKTATVQQWRYEGGLQEYLLTALGAEPIVPPFEGEGYAAADDEAFAEGEGARWVLAWTEDGPVARESFVNLIPTPAGGTHEAGLREGVFAAVRAFVDAHGLLPKGLRLMSEDVYARMSFLLSARVLDPQFQGQIKERLNSRDAVRLVASFVRPQLEFWLNQHPEYGRRLAELAIRQAQARTRAAQKVEKKKGSAVAVLPGKLTDCESTDIRRNELFLVEGDSAGGSAKMGRDKEFQAILPLRGKVLNTWEVERDRLFANAEVHDIAVAIGVDPHSLDEEVDLSGLRYGKICILADADVDGAHIQVLLLTLLLRHFPKLIERGHVYVARPPLYRVDVPAAGRRPPRRLYCLDDEELRTTLDKLVDEGVRAGSWTIARFKGLGEMSAEQLWETTMNPDTRRLLPVTIGEAGIASTLATMNMLMGRGEAAARRAWLEEHGNEVEADV
ncbi:MAG: DNA topoisomerase IV subunit B [Sutterellaceae bacterium]|nr:type IIA DNA topoisomerase subunit B [Burkholderiaceae bacterium]MDW8430369.1 DNA topoisomerase IV subunit B [Sutterellaceae bacterium]